MFFYCLIELYKPGASASFSLHLNGRLLRSQSGGSRLLNFFTFLGVYRL